MNEGEAERTAEMYIGVGTVVAILVILLILWIIGVI